MTAKKYFRFDTLYTQTGWLTPACVGVDANGSICYLERKIPAGVAVEFVTGIALPGFINSHSHAFQYAMAGRAEQHAVGQRDDFWTWREAMYQCALSADPEQMQTIATMLYMEMLRAGYTHVAEFHYLHHDKNGQPYANPAEMGSRIVAAASVAGIRLTLIPVFYQQANFGVPLHERQRRFFSATTSDFLKLLEASRKVLQQTEYQLGVSVHSLRAVSGEAVRETIAAVPDVPFHVHVAEQTREVEDCLNFHGLRPMQWFLNSDLLNERFFLVHSTHLDDAEIQALPATGATVVLCPSTEGNLGDGFFRMAEFVRAKGRWCIGTDSHIGLAPLEELLMIDYRQRLVWRQRNPLGATPAHDLINESILNGLRSVGRSPSFFQIGDPLDAVVFPGDHPLLENATDDNRLSVLVYTTHSKPTGTIVGGKWVVRNNQHSSREPVREQFRAVLKMIFSPK